MTLLILLALGCSGGGADLEAARAELDALTRTEVDGQVRVETARIEMSDARVDLRLPGEVEAKSEALVASALGGYVQSVKVQRGEQVRKGKVLALVDADIHKATRDQAQLQLEQARNALSRLEKLGDLATAADLEDLGTQVRLLESQLEQAEARYRRAVLTAPFAGTVADVNIEEGEVANPSQPAVRLVAYDPILVTLSVSDRDVVALSEGQQATVRVQALGGAFTGNVTHVGPAADLRTRTFPVEVQVENPDSLLRPGMIAQVEIEKDVAVGSVIIPQQWIVTRLEDSGVFVDNDGRAEWRQVTLGQVVHDQIVIESGLAVGDKVVINGQRDLVDGDPLLLVREGACCRDGRAFFDMPEL